MYRVLARIIQTSLTKNAHAVQSKYLTNHSMGRSLRSEMNKLDTPGPGQYYHSESQKYKFAHTNELRSKDLKKGDPGPGRKYSQ